MASLLDVTLMNQFSQVFVFLFVTVITFAILKMTKVLGENQALNGLIALAVGVMFMFSDNAIDMVTFMIPWFVLMAVFIMLIVLNYRILGGEGGVVDLLGAKHKTVVYWIIIGGVLIVLMGLANNYGQTVGPYLPDDGEDSATGTYYNSSNPTQSVSGIADSARGTGEVDTDDFMNNLGATLFHPKVLGLVLILVIASFTIMFMVNE
ncbi:hypothetical protein C0585_05465 [Candidatus Woesearchaeota archaeon]|mgnify:CR=1 FL=1|nr:MAG: hypothetical protein C0585_05465 [Candidatus Woesearchaeota archaeon]